MMRCAAALCGLLLVCCLVADSRAHDARPVSIQLTEQSNLHYLVRLRPPDSLPVSRQPVLQLPADCAAMTAVSYRCAASLSGRTVMLAYPRGNPSLSTFFRFESADGITTTRLLAPSVRQWTIPDGPGGASAVFGEYLVLGVQHIALGVDHLLFVVCLFVLVWRGDGRWHRLLVTVTGFTLAHSLTLALSVLDLVRVPVPLVEALIALSILALAVEILAAPDSFTRRYPVVVASLFGLLHGFGFAAVLRDIGLPQDQLITALLAFNIGVEIGQILFIVAILGLMAAGRRLANIDAAPLARSATAYTTGTLAAFWLIDRTVSFWGL